MRSDRPGWLASQIVERCPDQAVAHSQVMIEKRERAICGEGRQPQREPRELHRHRVEIDAEQAALRDHPPEFGAVRLPDVTGQALVVSDHRRFMRGRQEAAGANEKRSAAHRRIENA